jgi:hypothetical protein
MASRLNGPALTPVDGAALLAAPGIFCQGGHFFAQRVIDRDAKAVLIHTRHHATKIHPVIRTTLQDIVLPLVNHFVRQGHDGLVILLKIVLEEDRRESDASSSREFVRRLRERMPWSNPADKHAR